jgi:hypothetical protein
MPSSRRHSSKQRQPSPDQIPMRSQSGSSVDLYGKRIDPPQNRRSRHGESHASQKAPSPSPVCRYSNASPPPRRGSTSYQAETGPYPRRRHPSRSDDPAPPPRRPRSHHQPEEDYISGLSSHGKQGRYWYQTQAPQPRSPTHFDDISARRPRSRRASPRPSVFSQASTLVNSFRSLSLSSERPPPRSPQPPRRISRWWSKSRNDRSPSQHGCTNILATGREREQHGRDYRFSWLQNPMWETVETVETVRRRVVVRKTSSDDEKLRKKRM